jgi:LCP family protein required for cell wall assembly
METVCDSMVVRPMDGETKKQYAATILDMYAKAQPRFVLGMAQGHTRRTAERRVRGIFMRKRSSRGTVAAAFLLAAVMALACFTTACQPVAEAAGTAETPIQTASAASSPVEGEAVIGADEAGNETDILMIGVDDRDPGKFTGKADVMMYMRVNSEEKTIKAALLMRDTLVDIEGHGKGKLNTAYSFGGTDLVCSTLENNFGLKPDYYMVVNFYGMEDIVDALGGVDVSVETDELEWLNININEINNLDSSGLAGNISEPGDNHLNGRQTVAYMRIRHPGGDAGRIERQQTVMNALFAETRNVSADEIPEILRALSQYVRTDMPLESIIKLGAAIQGISGDGLQTFRYPENYENSSYNGSSVVTPEDFDTEYAKLCDFLGCSVKNIVSDDGDFGARFPDKFTNGEVVQTDQSYQSRNVNISIKKVSENDVTYYVADVYIRNLECLQTAFADDKFGDKAATDKIAKDKGAILAVNGNNCIHTSGSVVRNGVLYRDDTDTSDMLVLNKDGTMLTYSPEDFDLENSKAEAWQVWTFGPMLLQDGQPMTEFNSAVEQRNPRTAIGYYEPGHYCFVVVDGRQEGHSMGMTLSELSQLFYDLGCSTAFNLDGGKTSEMVYLDSFVNQPYNGGRSTGDIVYIRDQE